MQLMPESFEKELLKCMDAGYTVSFQPGTISAEPVLDVRIRCGQLQIGHFMSYKDCGPDFDFNAAYFLQHGRNELAKELAKEDVI